MKTQHFKKTVSLLTLASVMAASQAFAETGDTAQSGKEDASTTLRTITVSAKKTSRNAATTDGTGTYTSDAVTVAGKLATKRIDVPHSVSVMTRQQVEDQQLTTVDKALARTPGVTMISNDTSQSQYYIRGYSPESMVDGAPAYGGLNGYQQLDMAIYDRLEVLKGPAGLLMGQGSPSGVINFVKKTPKDEFGASILTSYGSWANKRIEADVTGPVDPEGRLRVRGILAGTDRNFFYKNAHDEKWAGAGMVEFDLTPETMLSLSASYQKDDGPSFSGLPAYAASEGFIDVPRSTNPYPSWTYNNWRTQEYSAALEHQFDNDWTAKVSYTKRIQDQEFKDAYPRSGIDAFGNVSYARRWHDWDYDRQSVDAYIKGPVELLGRTHELLFGANYASWKTEGKRVNYSAVTGNIFNPDATVSEPFGTGLSNDIREDEQRQWGIYGQSKIEVFDPLKLILGGRISWYDADYRTIPTGSSVNWTQGAQTKGRLSPYAALVYQLSEGINAYASYSDIFISQTQQKSGGGVLDPRVGSQYEVGVKGEFLDGRLQASGALFYIEDTGRSYEDPSNPTFYLNAGKAESKGIELEVSGEILPGWQATAGYTYNHTEIVKAQSGQGNPLSFWLPEHSFKLWQQFRPQNSAFENFFFGLGVVAYSKSSNGSSGVRVQDPYAVTDLQIGYDFDKNLRATFSVNNVFDTVYRTRIGGLGTYNTYGDPRNFQLAIKKTF